LVVDGFSKTYAMTGWRLGFVHGPAEIIHELTSCNGIRCVCAQPFQWASAAAMDSRHEPAYRHVHHALRDKMLQGLAGHYGRAAGGAFYVFPRVPRGPGRDEFACGPSSSLLIIPASVFSRRTHFRASHARPTIVTNGD
jgi:aspartate aminotransferase/aminotransferase